MFLIIFLPSEMSVIRPNSHWLHLKSFILLLIHFRVDELRHKLIPLYNYDPAEEYEWRDDDVDDDEDVTVRAALMCLTSQQQEQFNSGRFYLYLFFPNRNHCTRREDCPFHLIMERENKCIIKNGRYTHHSSPHVLFLNILKIKNKARKAFRLGS